MKVANLYIPWFKHEQCWKGGPGRKQCPDISQAAVDQLSLENKVVVKGHKLYSESPADHVFNGLSVDRVKECPEHFGGTKNSAIWTTSIYIFFSSLRDLPGLRVYQGRVVWEPALLLRSGSWGSNGFAPVPWKSKTRMVDLVV